MQFAKWTIVAAVIAVLGIGVAVANAGASGSSKTTATATLAQSQQHGSAKGPEYAAKSSTTDVTTAHLVVPKGHTYMVQVAASEAIKNLAHGKCASPGQVGGPGLDVTLDGHSDMNVLRNFPAIVPGEAHTTAASQTLPLAAGRHAFHIVINTNGCQGGVVAGRFKASHARLAVTLLADYRH